MKKNKKAAPKTTRRNAANKMAPVGLEHWELDPIPDKQEIQLLVHGSAVANFSSSDFTWEYISNLAGKCQLVPKLYDMLKLVHQYMVHPDVTRIDFAVNSLVIGKEVEKLIKRLES